MISPSFSAVSNMPVKKSSAAMVRWLVCTVALADDRGRVVGGRIVVGDRAADGAAVTHLRVADVLRESRERRDPTLAPRDLGMGVMAPMRN